MHVLLLLAMTVQQTPAPAGPPQARPRESVIDSDELPAVQPPARGRADLLI